jgi:hypothetical protein
VYHCSGQSLKRGSFRDVIALRLCLGDVTAFVIVSVVSAGVLALRVIACVFAVRREVHDDCEPALTIHLQVNNYNEKVKCGKHTQTSS